MASNTGCRLPGELEMTCSTSDVAVCCSNASERCLRDSASSRVRLKLLLELARVRLELLFRCRLRFLRPAEMTHAGRPKLRIRRSEHSTPGRLLCETGHSAGP